MDSADEKTRLIVGDEESRIASPPSFPRQLGIASLLLNIVFLLLLLASQFHGNISARAGPWTDYASLQWNQPREFHMHSKYYDAQHYSKSDQEWATLDADRGIVAIDDQEASILGLPRAQRFPWDDRKGIYHIHAFHQLHCLKHLWRSLARFRAAQPFTTDDWHGFHCLDSLRRDVECYADDTPRFTAPGQSLIMSGSGQQRTCRDWSKLEQWAKDRNACYRSVVPVDDNLDRYKFCPSDSPYKAVVDDTYGAAVQERILGRWGNATS